MRSISSDIIFNQLEYFIFQIRSSGKIHAVNYNARRLIKSISKNESLYQDLFNLESYDQVLDLSKSNKSKLACIFFNKKGSRTLRWEFFKIEDFIICMAINRDSLKEKIDKIINGNSIYKEILLNILPVQIAEDLISNKEVRPKVYRHCSIMFTDVVNFSKLSFQLDPVSLIRKLDSYFLIFDKIMEEYGIEKIKTIGDSYMSASGILVKKESHAVDCCLSAIKILNGLETIKEQENTICNFDLNDWTFRIGIHSGPCISGVIGYKKYAFDIWGDSVNIASRMEKSGEQSKINISESTYKAVSDFFDCTYRGMQEVKNIGKIKMYFLNKIKDKYSSDGKGFSPNEKFIHSYIERFCTKEKGAVSQAVLAPFIKGYLSTTKKLKESLNERKKERKKSIS